MSPATKLREMVIEQRLIRESRVTDKQFGFMPERLTT